MRVKRALCRRGRRLVALSFVLPVALATVAYLASNFVPESYAGSTHVSAVGTVPTALTITQPGSGPSAPAAIATGNGSGLYSFVRVEASLKTAGGTPIEGATITFTTNMSRTGTGVVCTAQTDASGDASCGADTTVAASDFNGLPTTFIANYAGQGALKSSEATGP